MKNYTTYAEVLASIEKIIAERRHNSLSPYGQIDSPGLVLDSERVLSRELKASRGTIRRVLQYLEESQIIRRDKNVCHILPERKQRYNYAFFSTYHHDSGMFWANAYQRVWTKLQQIAWQNNLKIDFVGYDPENPLETLEYTQKQLSGYDLVVNSAIHCRPEFFVNSQQKIVSLIHEMQSENGQTIVIDGYAVGCLGAKLLLENGYKAPTLSGALINRRDSSFSLRIQGFFDTLERASINCELYLPDYTRPHLEQVAALSNYVKQLPERNFDSIFFISDEYCNLIVADLFQRNLVPDKFGIVAFDGTNTSRTNSQPITTIAHGTTAIAEHIFKCICQHENRTYNSTPELIEVQPFIYPGRSLRQQCIKFATDTKLSKVQ